MKTGFIITFERIVSLFSGHCYSSIMNQQDIEGKKNISIFPENIEFLIQFNFTFINELIIFPIGEHTSLRG